jgi:nucleoid DNA-binding protein
VSKSGLIDAISTTTSLTKREIENAADASISVSVCNVRVGADDSVDGLSSLNPTQRDVWMERHPQTGDDVSSATTSSTDTKALKKTAEQSTNTTVRRAPAISIAEIPVEKISRRTPATLVVNRAPARKTAKQSANKAVRRAPANRPAQYAPARKAAKLSAKKAVRRA